ncbi:MAG: hypothetical protein HYS13_13665 [Planctomycetia bacterium]|nr:hypothetical protein [Planctomycetia bacterium]
MEVQSQKAELAWKLWSGRAILAAITGEVAAGFGTMIGWHVTSTDPPGGMDFSRSFFPRYNGFGWFSVLCVLAAFLALRLVGQGRLASALQASACLPFLAGAVFMLLNGPAYPERVDQVVMGAVSGLTAAAVLTLEMLLAIRIRTLSIRLGEPHKELRELRWTDGGRDA